MQEVHTLRRLGVPDTIARTVWMFGFQRRRVRTCECDTLLPKPGPLPQTSQTEATAASTSRIGRVCQRLIRRRSHQHGTEAACEAYPIPSTPREPKRRARLGSAASALPVTATTRHLPQPQREASRSMRRLLAVTTAP